MSNIQEVSELSNQVSQDSTILAQKIAALSGATGHAGVDPFIFGLAVFILACFVGYFVVWKVTPALHTPLMAVTNAISGVIIVGAIIALGTTEDSNLVFAVSFIAITIASINIFGGFMITKRMLSMFKK